MQPRPRRLTPTLLLLVLLAFSALADAATTQPKTTLVSRQSAAAGGGGVDASANNPAISANGRWIAFQTAADNLGGPIDDTVNNIYLYDRKNRRVHLISRRSGKNGAGANGSSNDPEISADGRMISFETTATNLGGPIAAGTENIYVYDFDKKKVSLVSRRSGRTGAGANDDSISSRISGNGRWVAFETAATNLGGPTQTTAPNRNVYARDLRKRRTILISRASGNGDGADETSLAGGIDAGGRRFMFSTAATNLGGPTQTGVGDPNVYLYDRKTRRTMLVSRRSGKPGKGGNDGSFSPMISADGRWVAYATRATNLGGPLNAPPGDPQVYVYDLANRKTIMVSRQSGDNDGADGFAGDPVISTSGRFIAFETDADNLGGPPDLNNPEEDTYVYDLKRRRVELVGRASGKNGTPCDEDCEDPAISGNGRFIAIEVEGEALGGPLNPSSDDNIYVRDRGR